MIGRRWFVGALLGLTALGSACVPPPERHARVVIGDSIAYQVAFSGASLGIDTYGDTLPGRKASDSVGEIHTVVANFADPKAEITIELGTNDIPQWNSAVWRDTIQKIMAVIPHDDCVRWIGVYRAGNSGPVLWNGIVREELARRTCGVYVDWPAIAAKNPGLLQPDGIHLTTAGIKVFGDLLRGKA